MIKSSGFSHPAGTDDTTKLQRVKTVGRGGGGGGREQEGQNAGKEIVIQDLFRQIDIE